MLRTLSVHIPAPPHDASAISAVTMHLGREALDDPDDRCEHADCGVRQRRVKDTEILTWPRLLVVHFKRLGIWNVRTQRPEKDSRHVEFDLFFTPRADVHYHLHAVIVHGGGSTHGHFIAFFRDSSDRWFRCDDSATPRRVELGEVLASNAYMLWYVK